MSERNAGCELGNYLLYALIHLLECIVLDLGWLNHVNINLTAVKKSATDLLASRELKGEYRAAWLLKSLTLIDLTTLGGDDTHSNVSRLCYKVSGN